MTLYSQAESNIRKTWMYIFLFSLFIILLGWFFSYYFNSYSILAIAVFYSVISSFLSYWYSDKIVLALTKAKPIEKRDNPELYRLVENLCITAGLPLPKIYILNESQPNAFATGRNPEHAVVAVTAGLLNKLERTELEGVIAHELSHIGNRDALLQTSVVVLTGVVVMVSDLFLRSRIYFDDDRDHKGGAVIAVLAIAFVILAPLVANLIRLAISRKREFLADASGALLTRYPEGLAIALEKISKDSSLLRTANNSTAHLYIINPFKNKSFFVNLFSTHPPVEERIKALMNMKI